MEQERAQQDRSRDREKEQDKGVAQRAAPVLMSIFHQELEDRVKKLNVSAAPGRFVSEKQDAGSKIE